MIGPLSLGIIGALTALAVYQQIRIYSIRHDLAKHEELFQIITENAADMIALVDVKGHRLYNSPAYKRILGYSPAELSETSAFEQIHPDDRFMVLEAGREAQTTGIGKRLEYRIKHKNGTWRVLESVASTIRNDQGQVTKLVIVNRDITDRKRAEEQLEHLAFHDALTGLPNRRLFLNRLQHLFLQNRRDDHLQYAVLLVDIDGFRVFNDTMGPAAGDQVIVEMARRLDASLRDADTVGHSQGQSEKDQSQSAIPVFEGVWSRLGADEFTILLDRVDNPSDALRIAQRIQTAVTQPFLIDGREIHASASIGLAISTATHERAEDLLQDADVAMRRAKALGGSRSEVFDEAMHTRAVNRLKLEQELRTAIDQHQFRVLYQPLIQLNTRQVVAFEALLRWQHPEQGLTSPHEFLEAAEDRGLSILIGHWLMLEACRQMHDWQTRIPGLGAAYMSVNISARQFADERLSSSIQTALSETHIPPSRLRLELTEQSAMADPKHTLTVLSNLKHLGIGAIVDDFGAGNASLNWLRQTPVEALKIDRCLINEMLADRDAFAAVDLIVTLARKMNLKVIAEGIESAKQADRLLELGCEFGQGYLFSKPLDAAAMEEFLQRPLKTSGAVAR